LAIQKKHVIIGTLSTIIIASIVGSVTNFGFDLALQNFPLGVTKGISPASLITLCLTASCEPYYNPSQPANSPNNIQAAIAFQQGLSTCSACSYNSNPAPVPSPTTQVTPTATVSNTPVSGNTVVAAPSPSSSSSSNSAYSLQALSIDCSITNVYQLVDTGGGTYSKYNTGNLFGALYYDDLVISANGKTLDHINMLVYLYCSNPGTVQEPYLDGGSLQMNFQAYDVNGNLQNIGTVQETAVSPISSSLAGQSVEIGSFTLPASAIQSVVGASTSFPTVVEATVSGNLEFNEGQATQAALGEATAQFTPVTTSFGLTVTPTTTSTLSSQTPTPSPPTTSNGITINTGQSIVIPTQTGLDNNNNLNPALSKTIGYEVTVNDWSNSQQTPVIKIINYPSDTISYGTVQLTQTPSTVAATNLGSGHTESTWTGTINLSQYNISLTTQACYSLQLGAEPLSGGSERYASTISFCVMPTNPTPQPAPSTSSSTVTSSTPLQLSSYYFYTITGTNGAVIKANQIGTSPLISTINLNALSLLFGGSSGTPIQSMSVYPGFEIPSSGLGTNPAFTSTGFNGYYTVTVPTSTNPNYQIINEVIPNVKISYLGNNFATVPPITLTPAQIDSQLANANQLLSQQQGTGFTSGSSITPITIKTGSQVTATIVYNGTFSVTNTNTGQVYNAVVPSITFTQVFTYQPTSTSNSGCTGIVATEPASCTNGPNTPLPAPSVSGNAINCENVGATWNNLTQTCSNPFVTSYCIAGMTANQCLAAMNAAIEAGQTNNVPNNNGACNSSTVGVPCGSTPVCTNGNGNIIACTNSTSTTIPPPTTSVTSNEETCIIAGNIWNSETSTCTTPTQVQDPVANTTSIPVCPVGDTAAQCASYLYGLVNVNAINWNEIIDISAVLAVVSIIAVMIWRKYKK
jgi:hypothetical protein